MGLNQKQRAFNHKIQQFEAVAAQHPLCRLSAILQEHPMGSVAATHAIQELLPPCGLDPQNLPSPIGEILIRHFAEVNRIRGQLHQQQIAAGISGLWCSGIPGDRALGMRIWIPIKGFALTTGDLLLLREQKTLTIDAWVATVVNHGATPRRYDAVAHQWQETDPRTIFAMSACYNWAQIEASEQEDDDLWYSTLYLKDPVVGDGDLEFFAT